MSSRGFCDAKEYKYMHKINTSAVLMVQNDSHQIVQSVSLCESMFTARGWLDI